MWVDHKPVDDGYKSIHMMLIHKFHVLELRIEMNVCSSRNIHIHIFQQ